MRGPAAPFVLARLGVEACLDAASVLPPQLAETALREVLATTVLAAKS